MQDKERLISMEKYIYDSKNGLWYELRGDYFFPILGESLMDEPVRYGKYGMLRKTYLKEHKFGVYQSMILQSCLNAHLNQVDEEANSRMEILVEKIAEAEEVTEKLKAKDPMRWCRLMNNIRYCAEEIVLEEIVYM